tara:strand:- start:9007 stop:9753 length:747 start_codon:yes stop_codon:yes gene_type:complete
MTAPKPIIQNIKGKDYEVVASRLARFRYDHPERAVLTECIHNGEERVVYKATICDENHLPIAVGHAEEYRNAGMINKTSATENCETSAIGRALGILGYDVCNSIASADEVERAISQQDSRPFSSSAPAPAAPSHTPAPPPAGSGGGAAGDIPPGHRLVELRKYFENETSKGKPYIKAFAKVDGQDMDVYVWDEFNLQIIKDNCPGQLAATGEYEEFRGKTRFKLANAQTIEAAPAPQKGAFDDSEIPF